MKQKDLINYKGQDERELVLMLIEEIERTYGFDIYCEIDTDSPNRQFKSGYDFLISWGGKVVFFEAKKSNRRPAIDIKKKLTDYQDLTLLRIANAKSPAYILEFVCSKFISINLFQILPNQIMPVQKNMSIVDFVNFVAQ